MTMVTESGDVPVPSRARWAKITTAGPAGGAARAGSPTHTVIQVSDRSTVHVQVDPAGGREAGMVLIEWLFDEDDLGGGH